MKLAKIKSVGLGLRTVHYDNWISGNSNVGWCEVISENYMFTKGPPLDKLKKVRLNHEIALHGVSMSIGSSRTGFSSYLDALNNLIKVIDPWIVTDHFCWTGLKDHNTFDLLPLPFTHDSIAFLINAIDRVQNKLKRKVYFENISAYIGFQDSTLQEVDFLNDILRKTGCGLLFDINNLYVNSCNFSFNPYEYIDKLNKESIGEIHLAGHSKQDDFLFDTHDTRVCDEVWDLYKYTLKCTGKIPTLIEWDESIPSFDVLVDEGEKAAKVMNGEISEYSTNTKRNSEINYREGNKEKTPKSYKDNYIF